MNFLDKLERKFGRFAIPDLMKYLIVINVTGFVLYTLNSTVMYMLIFDAQLILEGQIWRLVTFIFMPMDGSILWFGLLCYIFYYFGSTLEQTWGTFRFNLYIFFGLICTVIAGILSYVLLDSNMNAMSMYYLYHSLFFALASIYPDTEFRIYFILPIKAKYLAVFSAAMISFEVIQAYKSQNWGTIMVVVAMLLNFFVFFLTSRVSSPRQVHRSNQFKRQIRPTRERVDEGGRTYRHKCAICGRTELDDEDLEFRFCSKCHGNHEYCQNHLFSHEHR